MNKNTEKPHISGVILFIIFLALAIYTFKDNDKYLAISIITVFVVGTISYIRNHIKANKKRYYTTSTTIHDVDRMSGPAFERFFAHILEMNGYKNVDVTPTSGDFGADVIATNPFGKRCAIQCKRYSDKVSNKAVQEVYAAMSHYGCSVGMVVTNNYFTKAAYEQARSTGIKLIDRDGLIQMMTTTIVDINDYRVEPEHDLSRQDILDAERLNDTFTRENCGMSWLAHQCRWLTSYSLSDNNLFTNFIAVDESDLSEIKLFYSPDEETTIEQLEENADIIVKEIYRCLYRKADVYSDEKNIIVSIKRKMD